MLKFVNSAIRFGRQVWVAVQPKLPIVAVVGGSVAVAGGTFLACKATLEVDTILAEHKATMDHLKEASSVLASAGNIAYDSGAKKRDTVRVYAATAGKIAKLYAPAAALTVAGFASIFAGFGMIRAWHAAAVETVAAIDQKFGKYRSRVIDKYGKEEDTALYNGEPTTTTQKIKTTDSEGNTQEREVDTVSLDDITEDDFTWVFDWHSPKWDDGWLYNDRHITEIQTWYTKQLRAPGAFDHVFLNTIGKEFGKPENGIGHFYGWTDKPGANVFLSAQPFVRMWGPDDDNEYDQFPMVVMLPVGYTEEGDFYFINQEDEDLWKETYAIDDRNVGYILHFNVDTDENGVPHEIYSEVYGSK